MAKEIKVPQIAEGADTATVTEILVSKGDSIEKDQSLIVVESDKASVEIPSPESGTVKSINVGEGDEVKVGDVILSLEISGSEDSSDDDDDEGEESDKPKKEEKEKDTVDGEDTEETQNGKEDEEDEEDAEGQKSETSDADEDEENDADDKEDSENPESETSDDAIDKKDGEAQKTEESDDEDEKDGSDRKENEKEDDGDGESKLEKNKKKKSQESEVGVAPGVRRLARELGIDLNEVDGSGKAGHISKEDVKAHAKNSNAEAGNQKFPALPDFSKWGDIETKSLSGIRSATAKNVSLAWNTVPHVFQFDEAEISGIEKYIDINSKKAEKAGGKLTITAVLVKVVAGALRHFPKFNASIDMANDRMVLKKYVNIGIAVDTEKGLLVPVLKNPDKKSIIDISVEITKLAEKAREGKLAPDEMKGGNFTISNLGGIGGTQFTPIILSPQVAILGVSRASKKPVYLDGKFGARNILPLSLSYDHRLIDGAEGVRFIDWIARALEDPYSALLEG